MIDALADLYAINPARPGDILLQPQRWCHHQWQQLFAPFDASASQFLQAAGRVVQIFFLILPTLLSYCIGLVGITIKILFSEFGHTAPPPAGVPVDAGNVDPIMRQRNLARAMFAADGEQPPSVVNNAVVERNNPCCFKEDLLGRDVMIHIASFLSARDKVSVMNVSQVFSRVAKADLLWISYLEEQRLWGGSLQWRRSYVPNVGLQFVGPQGVEQYPPAYNQLKTYYELRIAQIPDFIDYIARLMRGGPVGFSRLPSLNNIVPEQIGPDHITHPIMYGKTGDVHLFALRLRTEENGLVTTLILYNNPPSNQWVHRGDCMPLRGLKVRNESHVNYILRLINGERLGQIPEGFPANPQLA